ncbi:MAG: hypothetical protein IPQ18_09665 [Saprospiraceae bacterium]|nr:hypothetical protein [Saprospiraceae bacterium]
MSYISISAIGRIKTWLYFVSATATACAAGSPSDGTREGRDPISSERRGEGDTPKNCILKSDRKGIGLIF